MSLETCRSILAPVDFSPDSLAALRAALVLAQKMACPITVLHVVHDPSDRPGFYHSRKAGFTVIEGMEAAAEEMMEEFLSHNNVWNQAEAAGVQVTTLLLRGLPVTQILHHAQVAGADLIVMGSRGRTGLSNLLIGSRAQRVVQLSPIPVMVVKAEPSGDEVETTPEQAELPISDPDPSPESQEDLS